MFYYLEGTVSDIDVNLIVLNCSGIGFAVNATTNTIADVSKGTACRLYISEIVKEDAFDLYGFSTKRERQFFDMLISVSGIGPKAALSILSANTPDGLSLAVASGNEKALTVAPGIGKKIAQRVILELKDKIGSGVDLFGDTAPVTTNTVSTDNTALNDAVAALSVLGYNPNEISRVLRSEEIRGLNTEEIIKLVLRKMVK